MDHPEVSAAERHLLFGLLALQNGLVDQAGLVAAFQSWARDRGRTLADLLVDRGDLDADDRLLVEALVERHLRKFGPDPERSVAGLAAADPSIRVCLAALEDSELTSLIRPLDPGSTEPDSEETATFAPLTSATALGDRYRILRPHARGGLGAVFVAMDEQLHREVALKQILDSHADDPTSRQRFLLEAEVTGRLEHPGVVPVYGLGGREGERPYYAMRLVRGETLKEAIAGLHRHPPSGPRGRFWRSLALTRLFRRFLQVCDAVAYAHSRGVVHRDLKPSNILLGPFGETLVVDWGLAKVVGRPEVGRGESNEETLRPASTSGSTETVIGTVVGTPSYMSPEQAAGRLDRVGPGSDVYGLGATLFALLIGRPPVEGTDTASVLDRVRRGEVAAPRAVRPDLPRALDAICRKAMALRPADRYASPSELGKDLEHWLADEPVSAHRDSWAERLAREARRHRSVVLASTAALVVVTVVSVVAAIGIGRSLRETRRMSARLAFDRGIERCSAGEVHGGLLELTRALGLADSAGDGPLQRACRANLAAWLPRSGRFLAELEHPGPVGEIRSLAFSPDGRTLATASWDGSARLWDATTGAPRATLEHPGAVRSVAFSPDGRVVLTACGDGSARLWDPTDGSPIGTPLAKGGSAMAAAFSPDGRTIAVVGSGPSVQLWDAATGRPLGAPRDQGTEVVSLGFSPDSLRLLTGGSDGSVRIWDARDGAPIGTLPSHGRPVVSVAYSPDGRRFLTAGWDGSARVWDAETLAPLGRPMTHPGAILAACFSPDGRTVLTGGVDSTARLWDAETGAPRTGPLRHGGWVFAVAFHPTEPLAFTGSGDSSVRIWETTSGQPIASALPHGDVVVSLAVDSDGRSLVSGGTDDRARVWRLPDLGPAPVAHSAGGENSPRAFALGGTVYLVGNGRRLERLDARTGRRLGPPIELLADVTALGVSADGRRFVVGDASGSIRLGDAESGRLDDWSRSQDGVVSALAISEGARRVLAGSARGVATLWSLDEGGGAGDPVGRIEAHAEIILSAAISPDGRMLLTASRDKTARRWDARTLEPIGPPLAQRGWIRDAEFSPDGRLIATAGGEGEIQLWDAATGLPVGEPMTDSGLPLMVRFSPDGRTLLVGCDNGVTELWHVESGSPIGPLLLGDLAVRAIDFAPDGRSILVGTRDDRISRRALPPPLDGDPDTIRRMLERRTGQASNGPSGGGR